MVEKGAYPAPHSPMVADFWKIRKGKQKNFLHRVEKQAHTYAAGSGFAPCKKSRDIVS
jgi:hypothetical protein